MAIRIRDSVIKVWSSQTERQYGIDKPIKFTINSAAEETFLAMMELGIAEGQLELAAELAGLAAERAWEIVEKLSEIIEDFSPKIARAELHSLPSPQRFHYEQRQKSVVYIQQLDRFGRLLVHSLAHAGIGKIIVGDSQLISESDCGRLGYSIAHLNKSKLGAIRSETANAPCEIKLDNRMSWEDYSMVDVAAVSASGAFQPTDYQRWLSLSTPHLGVCFSDKRALITSMIDERSACLGCRELNKWEKDETQRMVCGQIAGVGGMQDSISVLFAASLASQRILSFVDSAQVSDDVHFWSDGQIDVFRESVNLSCGCQQASGEISTAHLNVLNAK